MMDSYLENRRWSDRFIPRITQIVGPHLLMPASFQLDTEQATDLIVLHARDMRIAARVRSHKYIHQYGYEFTIRSKSRGHKTEIDKINDGWGEWMFYGFANLLESDIERWYIINLDIFRSSLIKKDTRKHIQCVQKDNGDDTALIAFDIRTFPQNILVASSHSVEFNPVATKAAFSQMPLFSPAT